MDMIIVVMAFVARLTAKRIFDIGVRSRYRMQDPPFHKGLQRTVHRYPVKLLPRLFLNIPMRKGPGMGEEDIQDLPAAVGDTQLVVL